jgi:hypothetical protein
MKLDWRRLHVGLGKGQRRDRSKASASKSVLFFRKVTRNCRIRTAKSRDRPSQAISPHFSLAEGLVKAVKGLREKKIRHEVSERGQAHMSRFLIGRQRFENLHSSRLGRQSCPCRGAAGCNSASRLRKRENLWLSLLGANGEEEDRAPNRQ